MKLLSILITVGALAIAGYSFIQKDQLAKNIDQKASLIAESDAIKQKAKAQDIILKGIESKIEALTGSEVDSNKVNIDVLSSQKNQVSKDLEELSEIQSAQEKEIAQYDSAVKSVENLLSQLQSELQVSGSITVENLPDVISKLQEDLKSKELQVEESKTLVASAQKDLDDVSSKVEKLKIAKAQRSERIELNSFSSRVSAVQQQWGFLIVAAGKSAGLSEGSDLIVQRNGRYIATVKVSRVEGSQTVAEIEKDDPSASLIQVGDRVILKTPLVN